MLAFLNAGVSLSVLLSGLFLPGPTQPPVNVEGYAQTQIQVPLRDPVPVRWNPCAPITWSWPDVPAEAAADAEAAFTEAARASGLTFVAAPQGQTGQVQVRIQPLQPWQVTSGLHGFGWATPISQGPPGHGVYVRAQVQLSPDLFGDGPYSDTSWRRATLIHELGHVIGLAHSDNAADTMFAQVFPDRDRFGPTDETRMVAVGPQQGCLRVDVDGPQRRFQVRVQAGDNAQLTFGR